jgi:hypothetical protein
MNMATNFTYWCRTTLNVLFFLFVLTNKTNAQSAQTTTSTQQIKGTVFRDFNGNGTYDVNFSETLVSGVTIKAYGVNDNLAATTTSANDGTYTLNVAAGKYRLEFSIAASSCNVNPMLDYPAYNGNAYGTSVRFVTAPVSNVNFGISDPHDYATTTKRSVATSIYTNGDPLLPDAAARKNAVKVLYDSIINISPTPSLNNTTLANNGAIGSVWGVAYSKQAAKLFYSAVVKRHAGLGSGAGGASTGKATGAIYIVDTASGGTVRLFVDLDNLNFATRGTGAYPYAGTPKGKANTNNIPFNAQVGTNAERGIPDASNAYGDANFDFSSYDAAALAQIGKIGLGGLDISDDGKFVYVVNLFDKKLYKIATVNANNPQTATAAQVTSYAIPNPGFTGGTYRPWAVKFYRGKVYVGVVNDLSTTTLLSGTTAGTYTNAGGLVYEFNPDNNNFAVHTTISLNYDKQSPDVYVLTSDNTANGNNNFQHLLRYNPWNDNYNNFRQDNTLENEKLAFPQPIISDLEFDKTGAMYVGIMDRLGLQVSYRTYAPADNGGDGSLLGTSSAGNGRTEICSGDVLYVPKNNCTFAAQLPSKPNNAEHFIGEKYYFFGDITKPVKHPEVALGGLASMPGTSHLLTNAYDPSINVNAGGIIALDVKTGTKPIINNMGTGVNVYDEDTRGITTGKGIGLGDIEVIAELAPLEIGNRVWYDANANGIQNANENGIANVNIDLFIDNNNDGVADGSRLATTVTNTKGEWYFNNTNVTNGLKANTTYIVRLSTTGTNADWNATNGTAVHGKALSGLVLTYNDRVGNGLADMSDNDAVLRNSVPQIVASVGEYGQNKHDFDFGFIEPTLLPNSLQFEVVKNAQRAVINITTEFDADVEHYEVERSSNGTQFTPIGAIQNILGRAVNNYHFTDYAVLSGLQYYRIKFVDKQQQVGYSAIKAIHFSKDATFAMYPNPAKNKTVLNISREYINQPIAVSIISATGAVAKTVRIGSASSTENIDISSLANGAYVVKITNNEKVLQNILLHVIN